MEIDRRGLLQTMSVGVALDSVLSLMLPAKKMRIASF